MDDASTTLPWVTPGLAAVLVAATTAAVAVLPRLGLAGGWPIVATGLVAAAAVELLARDVRRAEEFLTALQFVTVAATGVSLGGLLVAAARAPGAERVAIIAGLVFGFGMWQLYYFGLLLFVAPFGSAAWLQLPIFVAIGLAVAAAVVTLRRPAPAQGETARAAVVPLLVVIAVAGLIQLGHFVRRAVIEELRLSPDGLASQRRIDTAAAFHEYSAIALAVLAGVILLWLGYRRGKADLARWVVLGFALGGSILAMTFSFSAAAPGPVVVVLVAPLGIAAGIWLAVLADRFFAWETFGIALAALGILIGSVSGRVGPLTSVVAAVLTVGGFVFALAAGLTRVLGAGVSGVSLSLGVVTMLLVANAITPAVSRALDSSGIGRFKLSMSITSLLAALVILLLFGLARAVERVRREIRE